MRPLIGLLLQAPRGRAPVCFVWLRLLSLSKQTHLWEADRSLAPSSLPPPPPLLLLLLPPTTTPPPVALAQLGPARPFGLLWPRVNASKHNVILTQTVTCSRALFALWPAEGQQRQRQRQIAGNGAITIH